jgi:adenylate cyclase class 2
MHRNIEIKASVKDHNFIRNKLFSYQAIFKGKDHQRDTYFKVPNGRLKLRQGNIENALIHYEREDKEGPKTSWVNIYPVTNGAVLESLLERALGIMIVVEKEREIFFIENVKFHLDSVQGLGQFVEIEAIDPDGSIGKQKLLQQCEQFLKSFAIHNKDLLKNSYSDMLMKK